MRTFRRIGAWMIALGAFLQGGPGRALQASFPLAPGEIVVTCASSVAPPGYVAAVFDVNNPPLPTSSPSNWPAPVFHDSSWTNVTLGQIDGAAGDRDEVFGLALDDATPPNVYLTSTSAYRNNRLGFFLSSGTGKVYKIDGVSGAITLFAKLPNCANHPSCPGSGNPGLGNIAFDRDHRQLFVTNHFDGKIYRLSMSGATLETFDPFAPFNLALNVNGFVPLAERIWGVGVLRNRVYFGTWSEDGRTGSPVSPNRVYSIPLTSTGAFVASATATLEVTLPPRISGPPASTRPIADVEFSSDGRMLIAERTMKGDDIVDAHNSRVLEFVGGQGAWSASPQTFGIGSISPGTNSAGGVDYLCLDGQPEKVIAMGDALQVGFPNNIYGVQILDATGGDVNSSVLVDLDNETMNQDKSILGDVDALSNCSRCLDLVDLEILCESTSQITYTLHFKVKNNSAVTASHLFLTDLPSGLTAAPNSWSFTGGLAPGATSGVLTATIAGGLPGMTVPFRLSLQDADLAECCAVEPTVELPDCGCAQLVSGRVTCGPDGGFTYDYTVRNLTADPIEYVLFASNTPNLTIGQPGLPIPPVPPGGTYQGQVTFSGPGAIPGQWSCFTLSLHDHDLNQCCAIDKCVDLPRCAGPNGVRDLATGLSSDPAGGARRDASWKLVSAAGKKPAMVVGSRPARWPNPLTGTAWISADPVEGASRPGVSGLEFERCFCLGAGANAVDLDLNLLADDRASVFLNGTKLGGPAGAARRGRPLHLHRAGTAGDGLFRRGDNCLRVKVPDRERGSVGLDLTGTVTAPGGACPAR